MDTEMKERPAIETSPGQAEEKKKPVKKEKKGRYPPKRSMNLFYKPDRTTKPATIALYVLFVLVCLLGLTKLAVYDVWVETTAAQRELAAEQERRDGLLLQLKDYKEVKERYSRYAATDEERALVDRMQVLALLDDAVGSTASIDTISISGRVVQLQFSGVTLAETARIVSRLEASPIVAGTTVSTAATTGENGAPLDDSSIVQANMLIQLQKEAEEE